jgi:DNA-binding XRE family transcriptional regulator
MIIKPILNYPDYLITKDGQVWSRISKRWLKARDNYRGYLQIALGRKGIRKIHQLVLETYVGLRPEGMECRHLNGNRKDNRLENLKWGTRSENMQDAVRHGTCHPCLGKFGDRHHRSKISNKDRQKILKQYIEGLLSQRELGNLYNVSKHTIWCLTNGKTWPFIIAKPKSIRLNQYE